MGSVCVSRLALAAICVQVDLAIDQVCLVLEETLCGLMPLYALIKEALLNDLLEASLYCIVPLRLLVPSILSPLFACICDVFAEVKVIFLAHFLPCVASLVAEFLE